jgi:hypothetical protein
MKGLFVGSISVSLLLLSSPLFGQQEFFLDTSYIYSNQRNISMARGEDKILCVFEDDRNADSTGTDIYGVWLDLEGNPIDGRAFPIVVDTLEQIKPEVTYGPDFFVVVWITYSYDEWERKTVYVRKVTPESLGPEVEVETYLGVADMDVDIAYTPGVFSFFIGLNLGTYQVWAKRLTLDLEPVSDTMIKIYDSGGGIWDEWGDMYAFSYGDTVTVPFYSAVQGSGDVTEYSGKVTLWVTPDTFAIIGYKGFVSCTSPGGSCCCPKTPAMAYGCDTTFVIWGVHDTTCPNLHLKGSIDICVPYYYQTPRGALNFDDQRFFLLLHRNSILYGIAINCDGSLHEFFPISNLHYINSAYTVAIGDGKELVIWCTPLIEAADDTILRLVGKRVDVVNVLENSYISLRKAVISVNPTISRGTFNISLSKCLGDIELSVFSTNGRLMCKIFRGCVRERSIINWSGKDEKGNLLPSGAYFIYLREKRQSVVKKVMIIR